MPTLNWIGKDKVITHHQDVPFKILEHQFGFTANTSTGSTGESKTETNSGNKIIHGDNLEALKALLPEYEGKIKCIYIDPPYNTGNESWVYNDNVNHPKIKKWLGEVVGKDGEDLTRHDKWLCMMYPRLKLLHKLLKGDGVIVIHIDENEYHNLVIVFEEIFGKKNNLGTVIWDKKNPKGSTKKISYQHESIIIFTKNIDSLSGNIKRKKKNAKKIIEYSKKVFTKIGKESYPDDILQISKKYKLDKTIFEKYKFVYNLETVNKEFANWIKNQDFSGGEKAYKFLDKNGDVYQTVSMAAPDKPETRSHQPLKHPITQKDCPVPAKGWRFPNTTMDDMLISDEIIFGKNETTQPRRKYLLKENMLESISSIIGFGGSDENFQKQIEIKLENPKPHLFTTELLDWFTDTESIVLDSYAGSGTTAHAVLNLNKEDGGNRKFILIEMEDYANTITAERVRRVINGYGDTSTPLSAKKAVEGTGGSFDFYELGKPIFKEDQNLNEEIGEEKIREYIYYTETKQHLTRQQTEDDKYLLDCHNQTAYYFYYEKDKLTTLSLDTLNIVKTKEEQYIIYADNCLIDKEYMLEKNLIFKKIPRDIKRF